MAEVKPFVIYKNSEKLGNATNNSMDATSNAEFIQTFDDNHVSHPRPSNTVTADTIEPVGSTVAVELLRALQNHEVLDLMMAPVNGRALTGQYYCTKCQITAEAENGKLTGNFEFTSTTGRVDIT